MIKIRTFHQFNKELETLWNDFEAHAESLPFQSYSFQLHWSEKVGFKKYNIDHHFLVCFVDNSVRAIFPFNLRVAFGCKVLGFLGSDEFDYNAPLLSPDMVFSEFCLIWGQVIENLPKHDIIYFKNMPERIFNLRNFLIDVLPVKKCGDSHSLKLPNSLDVFHQMIPKKILKDNNRMERRLNDLGILKLRILEENSEKANFLTTMIKQKEDRYLSTGARNIFEDSVIKSFYEDIGNAENVAEYIHLSALTLDREILATNMGFNYKGRFFYLMPTFNHSPKWRRFSLGRIHLQKLIQWCIEHQVTVFDFTVGNEQYKRIWCNETMAVYQYIKIINLKGLCFFCFLKIESFIKTNPIIKALAIKIISKYNKIFNQD